MSDKLTIRSEMRAFDMKDREFYDSLTDQERKKFSTFLMLKYGGNVSGSYDLQAWYLRAHNERVNMNFFDLGKHPKLQWLVCTTVSPELGPQNHYWLNTVKKKDGVGKVHTFLSKLYPAMKKGDIELMAQLNTVEDIKEMAKQLGWDAKQIKAEL